MDIQTELKKVFQGELEADEKTLDFYSHDASIFELRPKVVGFPKDSTDIQAAIKFVNQHKSDFPDLSITPRSRGTDMSGGAIGQSIILDVSKHMTEIIELTPSSVRVKPGRLYREFDKETLTLGSILPSYPASRELASVGGMVNNNSGGEMSLRYGKTDRYVTELKVVLADGNEYTVRPLNKSELDAKMAQDDYEGDIYKKTFELLDTNYDAIQAARPNVTKDSTGYHLWNVWNRETGVFDLTKLFVGAQGTLGIVTDIKFDLITKPKFSGTLVCYMRNMDNLGDVIPAVLKHDPLTFESFDDKTLWLSFKFIFAFIPRIGLLEWIKMLVRLIPDGFALLKGIPKLILLVEFSGDTQAEVTQKVKDAKKDFKRFKNFTFMEVADTEAKAKKFWLMRRESFNLLRSKVKDKHTAPYIDDFVVPPNKLAEFLPKLNAVIAKYKLMATVAGHLGDGNFHVIPLMKIEKESERAKLEPSMKEVYDLVLSYGGSISGEHNDGMVRGPWLKDMYGEQVLGYMKSVKALYDPQNIFNPHKKVDANWDFSFAHIRQNFDQ